MRLTSTPGSVSGRRIDRVGDPLDGLINLFDLALALAVGLLLAALSSAGVLGLVAGTGGDAGTPIPGEPNASGQQAQGQGTAVGTVYRLQDGTYVFAPSGTPNTEGATGGTGQAQPEQQPGQVQPGQPETPGQIQPGQPQTTPGTGTVVPPSTDGSPQGGVSPPAGGGSPSGGL